MPRRRRTLSSILIGAVVAGLLVLAGPGQAVAQCAPDRQIRTVDLSAKLAAHTDSIVKVAEPGGRVATEYRFRLTPMVEQGTPGRIALAHLGNDHAGAYADSPNWTNPANGINYYIAGYSAIRHLQVPGDCDSVINQYAFRISTGAYRGNDTPNKADWNIYVRLDRNTGAGWTDPWGAKRYTATNKNTCQASGGYHNVGDSAGTDLRTWQRAVAEFRYDNGNSTNHFTEPRKTTSQEMTALSSHPLHDGVCVEVWCDSPTAPTGATGPIGC